jgi:hypothetical protein
MEIKKYEILINEEQASFGLIVKEYDYDISFFKDKFLNYDIHYDKKCINIYSDSHKISFKNIDAKFIYYAFKTESLIIFTNNHPTSNKFNFAYEAKLE